MFTTNSNLGDYSPGTNLNVQLQADGTNTYQVIAGSLPLNVQLTPIGILTGQIPYLSTTTSYSFTVRATDNSSNISDRTFTLTVTANPSVTVTTPGNLGTILDSTWFELPINVQTDVQNIRFIITSGSFPPGIEMNENGIIRGYADPPVTITNYSETTTNVQSTDGNTNEIQVSSVANFSTGRQIEFINSTIGGLPLGRTFFIKTLDKQNRKITISETQNGSVYPVTTDVPPNLTYPLATLSATTTNDPTIRTYTATVAIYDGNQAISSGITFTITVQNQHASPSIGGPGYQPWTRVPSILNTRPRSFGDTGAYYGFPDTKGNTYDPSEYALIDFIPSGEVYRLKMFGYDFDYNADLGLNYEFTNLSTFGLSGDSSTGWITGIPTVAPGTISDLNFSVKVSKVVNPDIHSETFNYKIRVTNAVDNQIVPGTPGTLLGQIDNGDISVFSVAGTNSTEVLHYQLLLGNLPPNLSLNETTGEIYGRVAYQPGTILANQNDILPYDFTIRTYSIVNPLYVSQVQNYRINVLIKYDVPAEDIYIQCAPRTSDAAFIQSLLNAIPTTNLYRPYDPFFGKAQNVRYGHAYGIRASSLDDYLTAIQKNHYRKNVVIGELKTAVARDQNGNIVYEVVYAEIIDDLKSVVNGRSLPRTISWPLPIPGYSPTPYTTLYPNALTAMRDQIFSVLGSDEMVGKLPLWMTSQQQDGGSLGFTPAWVICYTMPGKSSDVLKGIQTWLASQTVALNDIGFRIDRFDVDKSATYNYLNELAVPAWGNIPSGNPVPNGAEDDLVVVFDKKNILD